MGYFAFLRFAKRLESQSTCSSNIIIRVPEDFLLFQFSDNFWLYYDKVSLIFWFLVQHGGESRRPGDTGN